MKFKRTMALLFGMLVIGALQSGRADDVVTNEMAVTCSKCATTWVRHPVQFEKTKVYRTEKSMNCEECNSLVANFFKTGKFEHTCSTCGDLKACNVQQIDIATTAAPPAEIARAGSVMCPKCQTVWVKKTRYLGKVTAYSYDRKDVCPGCQDMAIHMINTGMTEGKCPTCGETLKSCQSP